MDLYIDTYITEARLNAGKIGLDKVANELIEFRKEKPVYRYRSKVDIFKYTLYTYKEIDFKNIYINFSIDNINSYDDINNYIKKIIPKAIIENKRSSNVGEWLESISKYRKNDWVFYSPNNDHPYICNKNYDFKPAIELANNFRVGGSIVNIIYSHFQESTISPIALSNLYGYYGGVSEIIYEDESFLVVKGGRLKTDSIALYHWEDLYSLFNNASCYDKRVVRLEDLPSYLSKEEIISVIPKIELCRHYDGYGHTKLLVKNYIDFKRVPPLFIPDLFFEKINEDRENILNLQVPFSLRSIDFTEVELAEFGRLYERLNVKRIIHPIDLLKLMVRFIRYKS